MLACYIKYLRQVTVHACLPYKVRRQTMHACLPAIQSRSADRACLSAIQSVSADSACLPAIQSTYVPVFCGQNNKSLRCFGRWNPKIAQALNIDNHHNSTRPFFTDNLKNVYRKYMKMSDTDSNNFNSDKKGTF